MKKFDVIIIGAGIGGLICACYLIKRNLKVLIVEQQSRPGGYCSSFNLDGYEFDAGPHHLGGIKKGMLGRILEELGLKDHVSFFQRNPSDRIMTVAGDVCLFADFQMTLKEFQKAFPEEKEAIAKFFNFINSKDFLGVYSKVKKDSFKLILDSFVDSASFKDVLYGLLCGVLGSNPSEIPAWVGIETLKEFFFDPGYCPKGGMKSFSDNLFLYFKKSGGEAILSHKVKKVSAKGSRIISILTEEGEYRSDYFVANIDPFQLARLLEKKIGKILRPSSSLSPTLSALVVFLGLAPSYKCKSFERGCIWDFRNIKNDLKCLSRQKTDALCGGILVYPSSAWNPAANFDDGKMAIQIYKLAFFKEKNFWVKNAGYYMKELISVASSIIPDLEKNIQVKSLATPLTFSSYSGNEMGAVLGKMVTFKSFKNIYFSRSFFYDNLFLAGSWYSYGGVSESAVSGKRAAIGLIAALQERRNI